ncbi:nuclear transport factor 2 family protein [Streptomyces sp. NPDC020490]|uniref:nuclear transport factor 2 family protein n=1 Tax=Streptomyces sp. NPDC020490 TaxID=3365078 RepID=UPI00379F1C7C
MSTLTREIYEGFQRGEFHRWDAVIDPDVKLLTPPSWEMRGLDALKGWAEQFRAVLATRIDLVDEFDGGERAFITVNLHWKHSADFFGIKPTGREGTSVEVFLLTVRDGKVVTFQVAAATLDLAIYLWERGMAQTHNMRPEPIVTGTERP